MSQFDQVSVLTKANIYFDGKVTSRTVLFADGTKKTLGIMLPGEYEFGTDVKEVMEIQAGELKVLLPGSSEWLEIRGTGEFTVPKGEKFKLEVLTATDYICSYIHE
ncbi:pyrimidine/purine nucleoside phosphorylase [Paenibacillus puerhi]|uniref:pyrimidine/purine nucleoside phosphorylase n=1 Tax=Paenibacillus puerhi TaxID=2692622 RepID=UPI00135B63FF|nr:pyrimidine/purine nucleoside phosphorylase [Paenibacillus puerhi]